jgi:hypothetical protein
MAKKNRTCVCCGTQFSYCPTCGGDKLKPGWSSQFCSEDCQELWSTATKFNLDMISKEEAKELISVLELKPHTEYVECVQRDLKNILKEDKPAVVEETAPQKPFKAPKQKSHAVVEEK